MVHPLVDQVTHLAAPVATELNLMLVEVSFQAHLNPPVVRVSIGCSEGDVGLDDCEAMSTALAAVLDQADPWPGQYVLEVSSPGLGDVLNRDRDFESFRGFPVTVSLSEPFKNSSQWQGSLKSRDETHIVIMQKGRQIRLPRALVLEVKLHEAES